MPEPLSTERIAEIKGSIERAHTEIGEVCSEGPRNRFRMSIPANPARDTDLIVSAALKGAEELLAEVVRLKAELADLEGQNALTESHFNNHVAEAIVEQNALTKRAEAAEAEVARLKAENAHLDREWQSRGTKVLRLDEELRQARNRLWEVAKTRVWTNEDGKGFVFADDLRRALGEAVSE